MTLRIDVKFYLFLALQHFLLRDSGIFVVLVALVCTNAASDFCVDTQADVLSGLLYWNPSGRDAAGWAVS